MNINDAFPSPYLRAADLDANKSYSVIIEDVIMKDVGTEEKPEDKPVMSFVGRKKGLILNRTNASQLSLMFGGDTLEWKGQAVNLTVVMTSFKGGTPGIRVVAAQQQPQAAPLMVEQPFEPEGQGQPGSGQTADGQDLPF